jgi:methyl-accepting chemotaxis protein
MVRVAERSNEVNTRNMEMMKELKRQADVLAATNAQVAESMRQLRDNVGSVKNITNTIVSISSQTNLLALNASIESARAGEAGRGFAVVADQIRELSEGTRKETEQISTILEELTRNADQTAEAVEKSVEVSNEQDRMITGVADQFDEMNRNVGELVGDISEIDNMIESLSTANNQIVDNIMQLSATTEEVTAAAQQSTEITERNYTDSVEAQKLLHGVLEVSHQMDKYI